MFISFSPRPRGASVCVACTIAVLCFVGAAPHAQGRADTDRLAEFSRNARAEVVAKRTAVYHRLLASTNPAQVALNRAPGLELMHIGRNGVPVYYTTNNLDAAKTVRTWDVWPAGVGGGFFGVTGSSTIPGELAVWDSGRVLATHQEFGGRVTQMDVPVRLSQHSTHVSGTLIAAGVNPAARGMSYEAPLHAYDWRFDAAEMAAAAAGNLQISSHSYAHVSGWEGNRWYGDISVAANEDYGFGFYDEDARAFDEIAHLAPEYLIVLAAGNDRNDGWFGTHYHWDSDLEDWVQANDFHGTDYQTGGYDTLPWFTTAKNALLVGAVDDIPGGYTDASSVSMMPFSNWGPCDDGRIKPDIVANGFALTSCDTLATSYIAFTGTSMAAPNAAGSINLVAHEFTAKFVHRPLSSTLKAIVINTADPAGPDGPDYSFGWGLLNTYRAIELVRSNTSDNHGVIEAALAEGETDTYAFTVDAAQPVCLTMAWTDPPGTPPPPSVDPPTKMLVNDLDIRITSVGGDVTTLPWTLDRLDPAAPAGRGDNSLDNVEQIDIGIADPGDYVVTVTHKGALAGGTQDYALVWRGARDSGPTAVRPSSTPSLRLDTPVPHPVGARATIGFHLDRDATVTIRVYDVRGRLVSSLLESSPRAAGAGQVELDATRFASGVYFLRMETPARTVSRKVTVVR